MSPDAAEPFLPACAGLPLRGLGLRRASPGNRADAERPR